MKSKVLSVFVLGICLCMPSAVCAIESDDDTETYTGSSFAFSSNEGSVIDEFPDFGYGLSGDESAGSSDSEPDGVKSTALNGDETGGEPTDVEFTPWKASATEEKCDSSESSSESDSSDLYSATTDDESESGSESGSAYSEPTDVEFIPWWSLPAGERGDLGDVLIGSECLPAEKPVICSSFKELSERLFFRQQKNGIIKFGIGSHSENNKANAAESVYWVNSKLPVAGIVLSHKLFGEGLRSGKDNSPNSMTILLPTLEAFRGRSYTVDELRKIIFDESNWELYKATKSAPIDLHRESDSYCPTFESYISYLKSMGSKHQIIE